MGNQDAPPIAPSAHRPPNDHLSVNQLTLYAMQTSNGLDMARLHPTLTDHLQHCSQCRAHLDELADESLASAPYYPPLKMAFLRKTPALPLPLTWQARAGDWLYTFSQAFVESLGLAGLAGAVHVGGAARGHQPGTLLYESDPQVVDDQAELTIQLFADDDPATVTLCVTADHLNQEAFHQTALPITVTAAGYHAHQPTNAQGEAQFTAIPIAALASLEIQITP